MGRYLLLVVAGAVLGGYMLTAGSLDRDARDAQTHASVQDRALVREVTDAAHALVLTDVVNPATRRFRTALTQTSFNVAGGAADVDYSLNGDATVATFTVEAAYNSAAHRVTSQYEITPTDWPGPLWLATPYATLEVDGGASVTASDGGGDHAVLVDATRFDEYGLGTVLSDADLRGDIAGQLPGLGVDMERGSGMDDVRNRYGVPDLGTIYARALSAFEPGRDTRFGGPHVVTTAERYGNFGDVNDPDPRIVIVQGDLSVPSGGRLEGNGVLVVEGDFTVSGTFHWEGLVLVVARQDYVEVDLDSPGVIVRGSVLVDQQAPPPGGHTDLTVFRDVSGAWAHPAGEGGGPGGKPDPPATLEAPNNDGHHYQHTHRIDQPEHLGNRRFEFHARSATQQRYTQFRDTVEDIKDLYGDDERVYIEFINPEAHGAASYRLIVDGDVVEGGVAGGFQNHLTGRPFASEAFKVKDLESLVVDVASLRMLRHLKNRDRSESVDCDPEWNTGPFSVGCMVENRVRSLSFLRDRDKALTIQVVQADTRRPLYEASLYWHTKSPGHPQQRDEERRDDEWRESLRDGTARYGARIELGDGVEVDFDLDHVLTATDRLGIARLAIDHLRSYAEPIELYMAGTFGTGTPGPGTPGPGTPGPGTPDPGAEPSDPNPHDGDDDDGDDGDDDDGDDDDGDDGDDDDG